MGLSEQGPVSTTPTLVRSPGVTTKHIPSTKSLPQYHVWGTTTARIPGCARIFRRCQLPATLSVVQLQYPTPEQLYIHTLILIQAHCVTVTSLTRPQDHVCGTHVGHKKINNLN